MTKWSKCEATRLNTNIASKQTKIKLVNFIDLSSDNWMISNKQTKKIKSNVTAEIFNIKRNRKRISSRVLYKSQVRVSSEREKKCPHFLIHHSEQSNLILVSVANLVQQDFSHTLNKRLSLLTKYLAHIFVKIEWIAARELSSNDYMNLSFPGH